MTRRRILRLVEIASYSASPKRRADQLRQRAAGVVVQMSRADLGLVLRVERLGVGSIQS